MDKEPTEVKIDERCSSCGAPLDEETAFRISRAGRSYCCSCYLKHDVWGRPFPESERSDGSYVFQAPLVTRHQPN